MKRVCALLCACALLVAGITFLTPEAQAATVSGACGDNLTWTLDNDGTLTISGEGPMWDAMNDDPSYNYHENPWESLKQDIKKIVFDPGITYVGANMFYGCENLTHVTFADSITSLGNFAFWRCVNLEDFVLPQNLRSIGQQCFDGCEKITKVSIPDTVTFLDVQIFNGCSALTEIYIGGQASGAYVYGNSPLGVCSALEIIQVSPDNFALQAIDNVLYSKDGTTMVQYPAGKKDKVYVVPEMVTTIYQSAMQSNLYIEEIYFPSSLKMIAKYALSSCLNLREVHFAAPQSLTTIGELAFGWYSGLISVNLPDSVTDIGFNVFGGCTSLTGIWVGENNPNYSSDQQGALYNKDKTTLIQVPGGLSSYTIPASVTRVDHCAFTFCVNLETICYAGTQEQWNAISIGNGNEVLMDANIVFNQVAQDQTGDISGDGQVDNDDVILLMWHNLFPEANPLTGNVDLNSDGYVNNDDVVLLLWHNLFPEQYPLN